jgi:nicotinamidase-related amidase
MLLQKSKSCLVIIDVQEKLTPHVIHAETVIKQCAWLMRLANELGIPVMVSEQYPSGLGKTVKDLHQWILDIETISKVHFSCYREPNFLQQWHALERTQVVIAGIETHVCVLQTALDMNAAGIDVFVVVQATSSRDAQDHESALARMIQAGIQLVTPEMVLFEWLEQAGTPEFKAVSQNFLKKKQ